MIAYIHKDKTFFVLTICAKPCNGLEFQNSKKVFCDSKAQARKLCKMENITPWNF